MIKGIKSKKAFTLIELIVTIAVLAILVLIGAPRLLGYTQRAELARIQHDVRVMENEMSLILLENEVNMESWEKNSKDLSQLIAENKLFEKDGVAEKVYSRHLARNGIFNLNKYLREMGYFTEVGLLNNESDLGVGGGLHLINELPEDFSIDKSYKIVPEEYSDKIKTKLPGTFYTNSDGKVYYEHDKGIPVENKDEALQCPSALPDYDFEHETGKIVKWHGTEQYLTIPSHFLVDDECWPVKIIGVGAFSNMDFKRVTIPSTVNTIERDAFKDSEIEKITIPHNVANIDRDAFSGEKVDKAEVIGEPGKFDPIIFDDIETEFRRPTPNDLGVVVHPDSGSVVASSNESKNTITVSDESGRSKEIITVGTTLVIPEYIDIPGQEEPMRIETIHRGAFQGEGLIEVYLPSTLKRIEAYAFAGNQLNFVDIPDSVEYIGEYAFAFNQKLHSSSNRVQATIQSVNIKNIERVNNIERGNIVDNSGNLVNPLDGVEMKENIWITDADNFNFVQPSEPGEPTQPEEPTEPGEPTQPEEPTNPGQGGDNIITGNSELGFYGEVSSDSFVSMESVISESDITLGEKVNLNADWLKVSHEGKILYIAKNHILEDVSWNHLNSKGVMDRGNEIPEIIVDGNVYKVRTFTSDEFRDIMLSLVNGTLADYHREEIGFGNNERNWTSTMTSGFTQYINWGISEENGVQGFSVSGSNLRSWRPTLEYVGPEEPTQPEEPAESDIPSRYVQATEEDFIFTRWNLGEDSSWIYIGSDDYVIIPHYLGGELVTSYSGMFEGTDVKGVVSTNPHVTNMNRMFRDTKSTELELKVFDTSNVTNMRMMFNLSQAEELDLSSFDTSNVTNMHYMFRSSEANKLDISSFDTSNVTTMREMFQRSKATELDLSHFDISSVDEYDLSGMFRWTVAHTIDISSFDLTNMNLGSSINTFPLFVSTEAHTVYVRTQEDVERLYASMNTIPANLEFIVK